MFSQVWSTFTNRTFMKPNAYPVWSMPGYHYKLFTILRPTLYTTSSCWLGEPSSFWSSFCCGSRSSMNTAIAFPFAISGRSRSSLRNFLRHGWTVTPCSWRCMAVPVPSLDRRLLFTKSILNEKNGCWRCLHFFTWLAFLHPFQIAVPFHCLTNNLERSNGNHQIWKKPPENTKK